MREKIMREKMVMPCGSSKDSCNQDGENGHCAFEDLDHSVLQQPLNLGVTNVKQILKCIQSGSREVKDIVLNECNIIYECKACLALFRSLANFMYHKRCYCKKHFCEDMVLFEKFEEEEAVVVQPEAPIEIGEKSMENEEISKILDCTVDLEKTDIAQETPKDGIAVSETADNSKEKTVTSNDSNAKRKLTPEPKKTENLFISRRTRDKNAQIVHSSNPKITSRTFSGEEPPVKCAKVISAKIIQKEPNEKPTSTGSKINIQADTTNKEVRLKKIEIPRFTGALEKNISPFPKIIFKTIDANPHAVYQSNDKKKIETFGMNTKYETSNVQTKVDSEKLIIVLKKDAKPDNSAHLKTPESSKKTEMERFSDFHLTRRKRLMSRNDCNVQDLKCLTCKTQFMSLKTLYFHMLSFHSKKRLYYPCPFCKTLFVQMYGVTRHLISIHNKTKEQINKLRDVIKKKSVWKRIDDVSPSNDSIVSPVNYQIKANSQLEPEFELPRAGNENRESNSMKAVIKVGKSLLLHQCTKCNRVFGRKSSQVSHEKFCIMNNAAKTEVDDPPPSVQSTSPPVVSYLSLSPKSPIASKPTSIVLPKPEHSQVNRSVQKETPPSIKLSIRPKRRAEKQMHKDFVNSQTLKWRSANRVDTTLNSKTSSPPIKKNNGKNLEKKVLSIMDADTLTCLKCDKKFSSYSNLRRHVAIHVGWTRFKCKYCDYQAYNKSQCWAHIQKAHSVDDEDMEKSIVNLANSTPIPQKKSTTHATNSKQKAEMNNKSSKNNASLKEKVPKKKHVQYSKHSSSERKQLHPQKKEVQIVKKVEKEHGKETIENKKEKPPLAVSVKKILKKENETRREKPQATISIQNFPRKEGIENKKERPQHIIPIQKLNMPDYKRDASYKSVTTSNPTTIILSKKIPSSPVQSIVSFSPESISTSKISPIRTSPRKNEIKEPGERLITTLVTRSTGVSKSTPIQIKLPQRSNSVEEIAQDSVDKNCSSKEKLLSKWIPKNDLSSSNIRRDSAPLIIGLVPAANAGLNAQAKNSTVALDKNNS